MNIMWTAEERQAIADEGVRLVKAGKATTCIQTFARAQAVLPKNRRRIVSTISKVGWFRDTFNAALEGQEPPRIAEQEAAGTTLAKRRTRVVWTFAEKQALCATAARLLVALEANGPRDALEKAQVLALPEDRRRPPINSMTTVADWYHPGLRAARDVLDAERNAAAAANAQAAATPAPAPVPVPVPVPEPAPAVEPPPVPATVVQHQPPTLGAVFALGWPALREHIVQEIAGIVAEGIQRGLASVQLAAPTTTEEPTMPNARQHVPFVADRLPKIRPPSILVAGLKGSQLTQIKADFGSRLDLRFCGADESKDQLRAMAERADETIAVVDFLSHSHTDIIKARSPKWVELSGGMTRLREHLAGIASARTSTNGHAAQ